MTEHALCRLTSISRRGGGCACKLPLAELTGLLLSGLDTTQNWPSVILGAESGDDAAILKNPGQNLVLTTDVGTPTVDDPGDWGEMYTVHAISDVYAMGGVPIGALIVMGIPGGRIEEFGRVLKSANKCLAKHGIPLLGGHTMISDDYPFFGLTVVGSVPTDHILLKSTMHPGDDLVLTKPLGIGLYIGAHRAGTIDDKSYTELLAVTCQDNKVGAVAAERHLVNACADVTGWGLLGELTGMAKAAGVALRLDIDAIPLMEKAIQFANDGYWTSGGLHNFATVSNFISGHIDEGLLPVLLDPQTSGGLVMSCDPCNTDELIALARSMGNSHAVRIGSVFEGAPGIVIAREMLQ